MAVPAADWLRSLQEVRWILSPRVWVNWDKAEESFSAWAAARVVVKQLQDAAKKTSGLPDLPDNLQEDQEDDYISNITNDKSSDEEAELIGGSWGQIHQPIELWNTRNRL